MTWGGHAPFCLIEGVTMLHIFIFMCAWHKAYTFCATHVQLGGGRGTTESLGTLKVVYVIALTPMFVCDATLVRGGYGPRATRAVAQKLHISLWNFYGVDAIAKGKGPYLLRFPRLSSRPALRQPCVLVASLSFLHSSSWPTHFPITIAKSTNPSDRRDST